MEFPNFMSFTHLLCLGDTSADRDLDPEGDLIARPGDDFQCVPAPSDSYAGLLP